MEKPWDAKPGKMYRGTKTEEEVEKYKEKRKQFEENWDRIFGKKEEDEDNAEH